MDRIGFARTLLGSILCGALLLQPMPLVLADDEIPPSVQQTALQKLTQVLTKLTDTEEALEQVRQENEALKQKIKEQKPASLGSGNESERIIVSLKQELEKNKQQIAQFSQQIVFLQGEKAKIQALQQSTEKERTRAVAELNEVKNRLIELEKVKPIPAPESSNKILEDLKTENFQLKQRLVELVQTNQTLSSKGETLERESNERLQKAKADLAELQKHLSELEGQKGEDPAVKEQLKKSTNELQQMRQKLSQTESESQQKIAQLESLQNQLEIFKKVNAQLNQQMSDLQNNLKSQDDAELSKLVGLQQKFDSLQKENTQLSQQFKVLQEEMVQKNGSIKTLQSTYENTLNERNQLKQQLMDLSQQKQQAGQQAVQTLEDHMSKLQKENAQLKTQLKTLQGDLSEKMDSNKLLQASYEATLSERNLLKEKLSELSQQKEQEGQQALQIQEGQLSQLQQENASLKQKLITLVQSKTQEDKARSEQRQDYQNAIQQLHDAQNQIKHLTETVSDLKVSPKNEVTSMLGVQEEPVPETQKLENITSPQSKVEPESTDIPNRFAPYLLGPGDKVNIYILGTDWSSEPKISQAIILPDGTLRVPPMDAVVVAGKSVNEVEETLNTEVKRFYRHAKISLSLMELKKLKIRVCGGVKHQGTFVLSPDTTITQALEQAGGSSEMADLSKVLIKRMDGTHFSVDLHSPDSTDELQIRLNDGDSIQVPERQS